MRLAIIVSHPIQYYSPWFRHVAAAMGCTPRSQETKRPKDEEPSEANRRWPQGKRREAQPRANQGAKALQPMGLTGRREDGGLDSLHATSNAEQNALRVFYLWDFGVTEKTDKGFGKAVKWDVDLLEGYDHEFVPNVSRRPGTDWFGGLDNPELLERVKAFAPDAVLQFGYNYKSLANFDLRWNTRQAPLLFRGDSHLLAEGEQGIRHEANGIRVKRWARSVGLRLLFKRFACFLAVGKANADYFRAHGVPESKIVRCPHVVDNEFFRREPEETRGLKDQKTKRPRGLRAELGIAEDELVFLFAGKLEEKKQPMQLLEAFLAADLPKATLLFVGSGALEGALKERAGRDQKTKRLRDEETAGPRDHGTTGQPKRSEDRSQSDQLIRDKKTEDCKLNTANSAHRVLFVPFQNQSRMPLVYRTGNVLILPSRGRYETWGLAVNEAACCGLPAIVSSHVGCGPDLIEDGVTGWIFAAGNVLALQRALETAAANRDRLVAMGEALKQRVTREYSYQSATEALLAALAAASKATGYGRQ